MSENDTAQAGATAAQAGGTGTGAQAQAAGNAENRPAGGSQQTFTQEEVNRMIAKERYDTQARFSDYEDLKAKAEQLDAIEESRKSDLEKANAKADKYEGLYRELKAEKERAEAIAKAAAEYGVDASMLARMAGDVDDNARFLKGLEDSRPKYPEVPDSGYQPGRTASVSEEDIDKIKDNRERLRSIAANLNLYD